jgi:transglutaminase-like putative cysteine protease
MVLNLTDDRNPQSDGQTAPAFDEKQHRIIRPIGVYELRGLAYWGDRLLALDTLRGMVVEVDPATDCATVLNTTQIDPFMDATGLAVWEDTLWFTRGHEVCFCHIQDFVPHHFLNLPYVANGVAVWENTVYVTSQQSNSIYIYDRTTGRRITSFYAPGIGVENITVKAEELWVTDLTERSVYCLDRATGEVKFSVLTPFDFPTAIAFHPHESLCLVAYASEEPYIRDNPNSEDIYELSYRDRTLIHPLHYYYDPSQHCAISNGYLLEMFYVEEMSALEDGEIELEHLEWRIALPANTTRQKVLKVEPVGLPFTEEVQNGQRIAVFRFSPFDSRHGRLFGWRALIEVRGLKYRFTPRELEDVPNLSQAFKDQYLIDDDELAMESSTIQRAAIEAVGTETNILRQVLSIRNYVYDRMSYSIKPHIDTPDVALERGSGSCGEYVGILLALMRLNGIACRTIGRYKCPPQPEQRHVPLMPDFNHVWIEFYIPGFGWVPMESNVDDIQEGGPYPTRFFMGLPWFHVEMSKGVSFEKIQAPHDLPEDLSIGTMAINHVRFQILGELPPPTAIEAVVDV